MTFSTRVSCIVLLAGLACAAPVARAQSQPQPQPQAQPQPPAPPKQVEGFAQGFEPIENLPPGEQIPAARLVIAAYSFVWVVFFVYLVSLSRRLGTVQREVERLESDLKREKRG